MSNCITSGYIPCTKVDKSSQADITALHVHCSTSNCPLNTASGKVDSILVDPSSVNCVVSASGCPIQPVSCSVKGHEVGPTSGHIQSDQCIFVNSRSSDRDDDSFFNTDMFNHDDHQELESCDSKTELSDISYQSNLDLLVGGDCVLEPSLIGLCPMDVRLQPRHFIGGLASQLNISAWEYYLQYESNMEKQTYLRNGIMHGFSIVDSSSDIPQYCCNNYKSVLSTEAFMFVNDLILQEIRQGKYLRVEDQPHCVHALGAIKKKDGTFRPITDCKRPIGSSINNFMDITAQPFSYITVDYVADAMFSDCFMSTVDISAAYRSVSINSDHWTLQGISWSIDGNNSCYYEDTRMCFGLKCAPYIFTQLGNFVVDTMRRLGFHAVFNYIDDFLVMGASFEECQEAQITLITLLGQLGFCVSWNKCSSPSTSTRYLGIVFNSHDMTLSLPEDKLQKLHHELTFFANKKRATKRQIQHLCGILSHSAKVVRGGRTFSRRVIDLLKSLPCGNPRIYLSTGFRKDILWWSHFAETFNGKEKVIHSNLGQGYMFSTDASLSGYGLVCGSDWQAGYFNTEVRPLGADCVASHGHWQNMHADDLSNINHLELIPIYLALKRFAPQWRNQHVICYSDNTQVIAAINKGVSVNEANMELLRGIFWLCATNNTYVTACHVPGVCNVLPDSLSRIMSTNTLYNINVSSLCCSRLISAGQ